MNINKLRYFIFITKPGIVASNMLTATAGYFLAARGQFDLWLFIFMMVGITLVVAAGCVFNNLIDKDIDILMLRTQKRDSLKSLYPSSALFIYGSILLFLGLVILWFGTQPLAAIFSAIGIFIYVGLYSLIFKRRSVHGTLIGAFSGAIPPLVGYTAVTGNFDIIALLLCVSLVLWQMPHFYAIAIRRFDDYKKAQIRVRPLIHGMLDTKIHMICYATALLCVTLFLGFAAQLTLLYKLVMSIMGVVFIILCRNGFETKNNQTWARTIFIFSIIEITVFSVCIIFSVQNLPI